MRKAEIIFVFLLAVLSGFFVYLYQNVITVDAQNAQVLNHIRLVKVEYNSSDPLTVTGTKDGGFFDCNITVENTYDSPIKLVEIHSTFIRGNGVYYLIAEAVYSGQEQNVNPGNNTFPLRMNYLSNTALPEHNDTVPIFETVISVEKGFSARSISAMAVETTPTSNLTIVNYGSIARPGEDETYSLLSTYSAAAAGTLVIGTGVMLIAELIVNRKTRSKTEQLACASFLLMAFFVQSWLFVSSLPYPPPYRTVSFSPPGGGLAGLQILTQLYLEVVTALSVMAALMLLLHNWISRRAVMAVARAAYLILFSLLFVSLLSLPILASAFVGSTSNTVWAVSFLTATVTVLVVVVTLEKTRARSKLCPQLTIPKTARLSEPAKDKSEKSNTDSDNRTNRLRLNPSVVAV